MPEPSDPQPESTPSQTRSGRVTREELYELVWKTPIQRLAKEFGISDVALAKHCKKLKVPVPGRGYWAKLAVGRRVKQAKLPELPPNSVDARETWIQPLPPAPPAEQPPEPIAKQWAFEQDPANVIVVPDSLHGAHHLVRETADWFRQPKKSTFYTVGSRPPETLLDVRVSKEQEVRALRVMDAVVKAFAKRGWPITFVSNGNQYGWRKDCVVTILGQPIKFGIREKPKKVRNEPAKPQRLPDGRYHTPWQEKFRDEWSGLLWLVTRSQVGDAIELYVGESAAEPIEKLVNSFMVTIVSKAHERREWERERIERERAEIEAEHRRWEAQQRRDAIVKLDKLLEGHAMDWVLFTRIRDFIAAVRATAIKKGEPVDSGSPIGDWLAWATSRAYVLNPLSAPLTELIGEFGGFRS